MVESLHADRFEAIAASFVKEHRLPGAAVGVVTSGELVWSAGVGFADRAAHRRPAESTLYRIASITKTFTGTAIMQLRASCRLQLDDPVVSFLPELAAAARRPGAMENVTLRRLLSHESGLRSEPPGTDWAAPRYEGDVKRTLAQVEEIDAVLPPNRQWKYSNLGYQLLGEVIARVSGMPYPDYVKKKILAPLGMSSTSFEPLPKRLGTRVATGYAGRAFSDELEVAPAMPAIFAEGGLWSCVKDLSSWLCLQLAAYGDTAAEKSAAEAQVLSTEDLKDMHKPRYIVDDEWTSAWGSPGSRCARTTSSGSSTRAGCPGTAPTSASTRRAVLAPSPSSTGATATPARWPWPWPAAPGRLRSPEHRSSCLRRRRRSGTARCSAPTAGATFSLSSSGATASSPS